MKKRNIILKSILFIILTFCMMFPNYRSYADTTNSRGAKREQSERTPSYTRHSDDGELTPENYGDMVGTTDTEFAKKYGAKISGFLFGLSILIAVIATMYVGIKYITAGVNGKVDYKKDLIPMVIGAVLIASLGTILGIIAKAASQIPT